MVEQIKTRDDVFAAIDKYNVRFVRLWFTDILGCPKSFAINTNELDGAFTEGMGFYGPPSPAASVGTSARLMSPQSLSPKGECNTRKNIEIESRSWNS